MYVWCDQCTECIVVHVTLILICETGTSSCRLLVLPQEDLSALTHSTRVVHRCPSASSLAVVAW